MHSSSMRTVRSSSRLSRGVLGLPQCGADTPILREQTNNHPPPPPREQTPPLGADTRPPPMDRHTPVKT